MLEQTGIVVQDEENSDKKINHYKLADMCVEGWGILTTPLTNIHPHFPKHIYSKEEIRGVRNSFFIVLSPNTLVSSSGLEPLSAISWVSRRRHNRLGFGQDQYLLTVFRHSSPINKAFIASAS